MPAYQVGESIVRARQFAEKAIETDEALAAGHAALAATLFGTAWDVRAAERAARRAVELNPSSGFARNMYGNALLSEGRFAEALEQLRTWQQFEPDTLNPESTLSVAYFFARDYERALRTAERVRELEPGRLGALVAWIHAVSGRPAEAIAVFQRLLPSESGKHADALRAAASSGNLAMWFRRMGERGEAIKGAGLSGVPDDAGIPSAINLSWYWVAAADADRAFYWLERAYERRHTALMFLRVDPRWDPIRSDPRFPALIGRVEQH
jgi:adenylate cyclase